MMQTSQIYLNKLIWAINVILKSVTRNFILLNTVFIVHCSIRHEASDYTSDKARFIKIKL